MKKSIRLMTDQVGFLRWAAQLEIDSSSSRPGYFIGYFMGMTEILKLRAEYKAMKGSDFSLSNFHEKIINYRQHASLPDAYRFVWISLI